MILGFSRFSVEIVQQYGLDPLGYHLETGTKEAYYGRFEAAVAEGAWIVVPLWKPQFLHYRYRIRELAEPRGLLRGSDRATLIAHEDCVARISPTLVETLTKLNLANDVVSELDFLICREGKSPLEAADIWLDRV
ncbi:glycine betaine ABC transporter substrate-binding protein [Paraburkholderia youngii]|uniref:ABC-type glycine betaine transport system substrate-binding domain-containing protein n=1 Tax=Paraburkholderia youngii TaxID=2782701 RepID=A0A7Y6JZP5_9BURK|nr:glycine betaine ABC transporter substrate-binding protein [Paraburkholderia youngii]NUY01467.1 hypothetical protein [Paraburkholderia youngii]